MVNEQYIHHQIRLNSEKRKIRNVHVYETHARRYEVTDDRIVLDVVVGITSYLVAAVYLQAILEKSVNYSNILLSISTVVTITHHYATLIAPIL